MNTKSNILLVEAFRFLLIENKKRIFLSDSLFSAIRPWLCRAELDLGHIFQDTQFGRK